MTIAAASFFTAATAGGPAPATPPPVQIGFAQAYASAVTPPSDTVPTAAFPQALPAFPPLGVTAPVASALDPELPAAAPPTCAEAVAPDEVAADGVALEATAAPLPTPATAPAPTSTPTSTLPDALPVFTVKHADAVAPLTVPITEPLLQTRSNGDADAEPLDVEARAEAAPQENAPAPASVIFVAVAVAAQMSPFGGVQPVAPVVEADEPLPAEHVEAASPGKTVMAADASREPAPVAAPTLNFGEQLAGVERKDATPQPASGAIGSLTVHTVASRAIDAPATSTAPAPEPTVDARPGQIGREMGVEIARRLSAGGEELTVRLNPVELGRIEVRLSFDERGSLRAAVTAESAAALEMLRRDGADLGRALTEAGVRADADSFRFDSQSNGREGGQFWQRQQAANGRQRAFGSSGADEPTDTQPVYRALRTSGRVNLVA